MKPLLSLAIALTSLTAAVTGQVFAPDDSLDALTDAGYSVTAEEGPYRKVTGAGLVDGGWALPEGVVLMDTATPFACACSTGSSCTVANPDGGASRVPAPQGQTLSPGWSGSGCAPKPCVEMFGQESSWPIACPCPTLTALPDGGVSGSGC